jgi:hypothetical protein
LSAISSTHSGDSYTLGVGVHEEDTSARRLEQLLNQKASARSSNHRYEVINCGISGYGTRQERLFYENVAVKYQPDIVVLVAVWNDDMSYQEELQKGYSSRKKGKAEALFATWERVQDHRYRRPVPDFSGCVQDILELNRKVRANGARLAVVIFRDDPFYSGTDGAGPVWDQLTNSITSGLQDTGIPILDVGKALYAKHTSAELIVDPADQHPNHVAHQIAASEILQLLEHQKFVTYEDLTK